MHLLEVCMVSSLEVQVLVLDCVSYVHPWPLLLNTHTFYWLCDLEQAT